jgi:hypothetical protein
MDNYELIDKTDIVKKNKSNKTKKQINKILECKNLKTEEECLRRDDCLFNKTRKCQKKPTLKKDIVSVQQQPNTKEEEKIELERLSPFSDITIQQQTEIMPQDFFSKSNQDKSKTPDKSKMKSTYFLYLSFLK